MAKTGIKPYQNESDSIQIGDLTIENRLDRISIYGSIDLWKDKGGLAATRLLKNIIDQTLAELEKAELPDRIEVEPAETVENPFT